MGGQLAPRVINGITFNPKKTSLLKNAAQPEKQNIFMKNGNESRDVLDDSRKCYCGPWAEIEKYWPGKEPIRLQDSLPCPLKKNNILHWNLQIAELTAGRQLPVSLLPHKNIAESKPTFRAHINLPKLRLTFWDSFNNAVHTIPIYITSTWWIIKRAWLLEMQRAPCWDYRSSHKTTIQQLECC